MAVNPGEGMRGFGATDRRGFLAAGGLAVTGGWLDFGPDGDRTRTRLHDFHEQVAQMLDRSRVYMGEVGAAMPAEHYGFQPTAELLPFQEHLMRLVMSNHGWSDAIRGAPLPQRGALTSEGRSKNEILAMLDDSFLAAIEVVHGSTGSVLHEGVAWERRLGESPTQHPKWGVLVTLLNHVSHHRGAAVVYLRLKGIAPPGYVD